MSNSRKEKYSKDDIKLARYAKALSHPARISIIRYLATVKTCNFSEISEKMPIAGSTVSQHILELKDSGLVQGSSKPPRVYYCINLEEWRQARKLLKGFMKIN